MVRSAQLVCKVRSKLTLYQFVFFGAIEREGRILNNRRYARYMNVSKYLPPRPRSVPESVPDASNSGYAGCASISDLKREKLERREEMGRGHATGCKSPRNKFRLCRFALWEVMERGVQKIQTLRNIHEYIEVPLSEAQIRSRRLQFGICGMCFNI
jgi:hypothetical protein